MSDTEHEDTENPDAEPVEPIHGDDEEEEAATEPGQSPAKAAAAEGSAEVAKKLDSENTRHFKAVSKILDQDMEAHVCPTCNGFGFADAPAPEESELEWDVTKQECPTCKGWGALRTASKNPDHNPVTCVQCQGSGVVVATVEAPPTYAPVTQLPTGLTAQQGTLLPDGRFLPYGATEPISIPPAYAG